MRIWNFATCTLLVLSSCAPDRSAPAGEALPSIRSTAAASIVNHNWSDVRVYVTRGEARSFLGLVTAGGAQTFPVPTDMLAGSGELRLVADPVGSVLVFSTDTFLLDEGRTVEWTIRNKPEFSSLIVR